MSNKYLDRKLAKKILTEQLAKRKKIVFAHLVLKGDEFWNSECIYKEGKEHKQKDFKCYPMSYWATPELVLEYKDGSEKHFPCYFEEEGNEKRVKKIVEEIEKDRAQVREYIKKQVAK